MKASDDHVKQLLDDLGRALAEAIASSCDVAAVAARIRGSGYSLNLILNCSQRNGVPAVRAEPLAASPGFDTPVESAHGRGEARARPPVPDRPPIRRPAFRLNAEDVGFLKALGIDGTRPPRR